LGICVVSKLYEFIQAYLSSSLELLFVADARIQLAFVAAAAGPSAIDLQVVEECVVFRLLMNQQHHNVCIGYRVCPNASYYFHIRGVRFNI
jgi:hypothetical protein